MPVIFNISHHPSVTGDIRGTIWSRSIIRGVSALFKADGSETADRYSISEWWLEPNTQGPGAHSHPEDDIFYVLEGTMSFLIQDRWVDAPKGSFVSAPGGVTHDFENRGYAPGCSIFRLPATLSSICPASLTGSPGIHQAMQAADNSFKPKRLRSDERTGFPRVLWAARAQAIDPTLLMDSPTTARN